jgi:serine/threonine-protein kinase
MQPEKLGPYRIGTTLGRGGMGAVYQGIDEQNGDIVAVKVLLATLEEDEELRSRFELEIDTLKHLRHPNIVRIYGFGEEAGMLYYVMELVNGKSLHQELKKKRVFEWYEVAKIGLEMSLALKHAHDRGITHRDIKPANIMLEEIGLTKLSDFGIAQYFGSQRLTEVNSVVGTLEYMSPEQALAAPLGYKSDIYSLGAVLYALVVGKPPFPARNLMEIVRKHQTGTIEKFNNFRTDIPDELESIILDMLKVNAEERPVNMYLLTKRFQSLLQALVGSPELITVKPSASEPVKPSSGQEKSGLSFIPRESRQDTPQQPSKISITSLADSFGLPGKQNTVRPTRLQDNIDHYAETGGFSLAANTQPNTAPQDNGLSLADNSSVENSSNEVKAEGPATAPTGEYVHSAVNPSAGLTQKPELETYGLKTDGLETDDDPSFRKTSHFDNQSYVRKTEDKELRQNTAQESTAKFVKVDDREYESYDSGSAKRPLISLETVFASISLILIGVAVWYFLQPVPPDELYKRITETLNINDMQLLRKQTDGDDTVELSAKALRSASEDIKRFLEQYSNDPKAEQIRFLEDQLDLANKERDLERRLQLTGTQKLIPIERDYLEAIATVKTNPELTVIKLKALLNLYGYENPADDSGSVKKRLHSRLSRQGQCLEVARQRLKKLENDVSSITADRRHTLKQRLEDAKHLEETAPDYAETIYEGLIELYKDRPWADEFVKQARDALKKR